MMDGGKAVFRIHVCGHFQGEVKALTREVAFVGIEVSAFPPTCDHPQQPREEWQDAPAPEGAERLSAESGPASSSGSPGDRKTLVLGACMHSGLSENRGGNRFRVVRLPQCFSMFAGPAMIDAYLLAGAHIMMPSWLKGWREKLKKWGFDQSTARDFFQESCTRIVLLDTGVEPDSPRHLAEFGEFLGLPTERVPVGLDYFRLYLQQQLTEFQRAEAISGADLGAIGEQRQADDMMLLDLLENLSYAASERDVQETILDLFEMLFAPRQLVYLPILEGERGEPILRDLGGATIQVDVLEHWVASSTVLAQMSETGTGFMLRIQLKDLLVGAVAMETFAFPQYLARYMARATSMARLCGLVIQNVRLYRRVQEQATTDGLTGLMNRRHFFEMGQKEFARARRHRIPLSALMFDLDFFKLINDTHGHAVGDQVLRSVAACVQSLKRGSDLCGRYGGEEFAVLLPETAPEQALLFAERLRKAIEDLEILPGRPDLRVTVSLGVAGHEETSAGPEEVPASQCRSLEALLNRCDEALYQAKREGRNRAVVWSPS